MKKEPTIFDLTREQFDDMMCKKFPLLYADRHKPMNQTCVCWGFECGRGWRQILYDASCKLEPLIQEYIDNNELQCRYCGDTLQEHSEDCHGPSGFEPSYPRASQIKEKFGTLRFYMDHATDEMYQIIDEAERLTETMCEKCGKEGKLREGGWIVTLCDECNKNRKK